MIFVDPDYNKLNKIIALGNYYPYRLSDGTRNPDFDQWSGLILDIKNNKPDAVKFFFNRINSVLSQGIAISIVPSHDTQKTDSGLHQLARQLANKNSRVDATSCLVRHKTIAKLASGGNRNKNVHLDSIRVENLEVIKDREVLILDDVSTSGNSLLACKQLLEEAGVQVVQCLALGLTVRHAPGQAIEAISF